MKREFLGDSYDAVKRLWQELLNETAPLKAENRFIPKELHEDYTSFTKIPILEEKPVGCYSIFNDPDTGIRLPKANNQSEGRTHISVELIVKQLKKDGVFCVITFDQSYNRNIELKQQRQAKMQGICEKKCFSFYYVSHASFLFSFSDNKKLNKVKNILLDAGIPETRIIETEKQP